MGIIKEYKKFAVKGNVLDMAVGIVIGIAFGKIISSFVADIIMPPIGILLAGVDFTALSFIIKKATVDNPEVTINLGKFIQTIIDFFILSVVLFGAIKGMNNFKRKEEAAPKPPQAPSNQEIILGEIRDLLKERD
ncbi:MAG: large-conductance mechanosensitive channel protein MscL [Spirochaetia bacterium]|nr:large-conductance mechanosensitive channel protein MscL [Spirochaetia bacterium]